MAGSGTFTKGGKIFRYDTLPGSNLTGIFYEANETEFNRVKNKFGETYVADQRSAGGKLYVALSAFRKEPNGTFSYFPYPPGQESESGNDILALSIEEDPALRRQITGTSAVTPPVTPTTPGPGNTTPPPAQNPDEQGGSTPITQPTTGTEPTDVMLVYPEDLRTNKQDRIMFQAYEYQSGNRLGGDDFALSSIKYVNPKSPVFLPIQSSIIDQNSVGWESDTMNPIEVQAALLSSALMKAGSDRDVTGVAGEKIGEALRAARQNSEAVRTYLVGQAISVNNLLSRLQGQVLNPNLELLFQGPQLRPFNFTFKMSARNRPEAATIKKIIKYFKQNMATKKDNNIFLKAPNVFKIQYQYGNSGQVHPGLNLIKMCALTNCSVDYTPLGTYMTYNDGTMVAYTMTLSFQELTPIYDTDYDKNFIYGGEAGEVKKDYYYDQNNGIGA